MLSNPIRHYTLSQLGSSPSKMRQRRARPFDGRFQAGTSCVIRERVLSHRLLGWFEEPYKWSRPAGAVRPRTLRSSGTDGACGTDPNRASVLGDGQVSER
jgi:hypothetical protein